MKRVSVFAAGVALASMLGGCATTELQTQAKMTRSIFLEPVKKAKQTVFVSVHNTSGQKIDLKDKLIEKLEKKGYHVVDDPDAAHYILMVNVLFANNLKEANAAGAAAFGAAVGAGVGIHGGSWEDALIGGVAAATVGGLVGKATEDDIFRMVVDVVIREKTNQKVAVKEENIVGQANVENRRRAGFMNSFGGPSRSVDEAGHLNDNIVEKKRTAYHANYIEKRTRVFAEAVKLNLKLADAIPILEEKTSDSIAGIF